MILPLEVGEVGRVVVVEEEEVVGQLFGRSEVVDVDERLRGTQLRVVAGSHHDGDHRKRHGLEQLSRSGDNLVAL